MYDDTLVVSAVTTRHHAICYQPGELLSELLGVQELDVTRAICDLSSLSRASNYERESLKFRFVSKKLCETSLITVKVLRLFSIVGLSESM